MDTLATRQLEFAAIEEAYGKRVRELSQEFFEAELKEPNCSLPVEKFSEGLVLARRTREHAIGIVERSYEL